MGRVNNEQGGKDEAKSNAEEVCTTHNLIRVGSNSIPRRYFGAKNINGKRKEKQSADEMGKNIDYENQNPFDRQYLYPTDLFRYEGMLNCANSP